jgi:hypothetical protein
MLVHVQTRADIAQDLHDQRRQLPESKQLESVVARFGSRLEPLHPGTHDRDLATYFAVAVPAHINAAEVRDALLQSGTVEAAYVKPAEGPPG